jgi:hypothetical protein
LSCRTIQQTAYEILVLHAHLLTYLERPDMLLGTKNRLVQNAALCREHLRRQHQHNLVWVNEFISETECRDGDVAWSQFTDLKRSEQEMLQHAEETLQKWLNP